MKTKQEYIKIWNSGDIDTPKTQSEALMCMSDILFDIVEFLYEINPVMSKEINKKIEVREKVVNQCSNCGLKELYWNKMFCAEGGDHKE